MSKKTDIRETIRHLKESAPKVVQKQRKIVFPEKGSIVAVASLAHATIEVTQRCNSRCLSCNTWKIQKQALAKKKGEHEVEVSPLGLEEHKSIVDQVKDLGAVYVELHGGEPTLCKHLVPLIKHCTSQGIFTSFATNGLNMSKALANGLVEAGLSDIRFSMDGPRESHNYLRGRDDAFDKQWNAIQTLQAADKQGRVRKGIRSNVSSFNLDRIHEIIGIASELGIDSVAIAHHSVYGSAVVDDVNNRFGETVASHRSLVSSDLLPHDAQLIQNQRKQLLELASQNNIEFASSSFFDLPVESVQKGIKRSKGVCDIVYNHCLVDWWGTIYPCEYIRYALGNVRETSLVDALTGDRFLSFTQKYSDNYLSLSICDYCCNSL